MRGSSVDTDTLITTISMSSITVMSNDLAFISTSFFKFNFYSYSYFLVRTLMLYSRMDPEASFLLNVPFPARTRTNVNFDLCRDTCPGIQQFVCVSQSLSTRFGFSADP